MSIRNLFITNDSRPDISNFVLLNKLSRKLSAVTANLAEPFWCFLSFLLFLVMGPFSVFAVVIGLWNIARAEQVTRLAEPGRC